MEQNVQALYRDQASSPAVYSQGQCNYKQCYTSSTQYQLGNCVLHVFSMKSAWLSGLFRAAFVTSLHLFCVFIDDGSQCGWGLGEGSNFYFVRGSQKSGFRAFSSRRSSLTQTFVESCVDFEVAHLSAYSWFRHCHTGGRTFLYSNLRIKLRFPS